MKKAQKIIIGPSFYATGQALSPGGNVLVIGRNSSVGDEWSYSYRKIDATSFIPERALTKSIVTELARLGLAKPEENAMATSILLYKFLEKVPERFMLWTELENISETDRGFELTLYTVSGRRVICCEELVDNTVEALTCPDWGTNNLQSKRLNMLVRNCGQSGLETSDFADLTIRPGKCNDERIVECPVSLDISMMDARQKLLVSWEKRPVEMKYWKIASFGTEFDYEVKNDYYEIKPGWTYRNPLAFKCPLAAFDAGLSGEV